MSNLVVFTGRLADAPSKSENANAPTRFRLIRNDYAGKDAQGERRPDRVTSLQFTAFGKLGGVILERARKGDQLVVTGHIENNNYKDQDGNDHYGFNFVVDSFEFGAGGKETRAEFAAAAQNDEF